MMITNEEISFFVRDEQTGRLLFNAKALQTLGINPEEARQRGYLLKEVDTNPRSNIAERQAARFGD